MGHTVSRARCLGWEARTSGARGPGRARQDGAQSQATSQRRTRLHERRSGSCPGRSGCGTSPDCPHQSPHCQEDHPGSISSRVGMADVHPGQYWMKGHRSRRFRVSAKPCMWTSRLRSRLLPACESVKPSTCSRPVIPDRHGQDRGPHARVDPTTRNAMIVQDQGASNVPAPGASVRVRVPVGPELNVVAIPVRALRKGPGGDQVFVIAPDKDGRNRLHSPG